MKPFIILALLAAAALAAPSPQSNAELRRQRKRDRAAAGALPDFDASAAPTAPAAAATSPVAQKKPYVYLTFDDGPHARTPAILDVLKKHDIKATFFLLSDNLHLGRSSGRLTRTEKTLVRTIREGHLIGDHSDDHMRHNKERSGVTGFIDVDEDLRHFGDANFDKVERALERAGFAEAEIDVVADGFFSFARLPFTNAWRFLLASDDVVRHDCPYCTPDPISGEVSIELADALFESETRTNVVGWDVEWPVNWSTGKNTADGEGMMRALRSSPMKDAGKIVVLMHDHLFPKKADVAEIDKFIRMAKAEGYEFRRIDQYATDGSE